MQYKKIRNEQGRFNLFLDMGDITLPHAEDLEKYQTFIIQTYTKVSGDKEHGWEINYSPVNEFFATLSEQQQRDIGMTLIMMHYKINQFISTKELLEIPTLLHDLSDQLVQLDNNIDLYSKLIEFSKDLPLGEMADAGKLRAQDELVVANLSEFKDTVTVDADIELKKKVELIDSNSEFSMDGADKFVVYDTPAKFTATNFGNIAHLDREETSTGGSRISGYTQVNYVDSNRALVNPGNNSGSQFAWGVNNSQFAQLGAILTTAALKSDGSNEIDYVNSASRIDFGVWTGDPAGTGNPTLTTALMIEPHQNQITLNSIDGGVTNLGTDGDGISFQAPELAFHADDGTKDIQFEVGSNLKLTIEPTKITASVPVQFPTYTTTQRNALTVSNGAQIYNSTTNKMQAYAGGAWVDLH